MAPAQLPALARAVAALPRLKLRGLMCLPPHGGRPGAPASLVRASCARLQASLNAQGAALDTLSMGMSDDFEAAILEGATVVRLGTVLFGPRPVQ